LHPLFILNPIFLDLLELLVFLADHKFSVIKLLLNGGLLIAETVDLGFQVSLFQVEVAVKIESLNLQLLKVLMQILKLLLGDRIAQAHSVDRVNI
jgi:hypothetical protein